LLHLKTRDKEAAKALAVVEEAQRELDHNLKDRKP
jgi:hypothetical protein